MMNTISDKIQAIPFDEFLSQGGNGNQQDAADSFYSNSGGSPPVGMLWREFKKCKFAEAPQIVFGIRRGNVGLLIAETNLGKTTIALNIALTLTANSTFPPVINESSIGQRVMYVDGESTRAETQIDIARMMRDWTDTECLPVDENLLILCDEEISREPLTLSNEQHFELIRRSASEFKPALIIVDTLSALFSLHDENSNAEMTKTVIQPLKNLARDSNSAVLLLHHIGKSKGEEGRASVNAYRGRGASTLGCLARSVIALSRVDKNDDERVLLSMPKDKGYKLRAVVMRLDSDSRWFTPTEDVVPTMETCLKDVLDYVKVRAETADIVKALSGKHARRTVEDALSDAVKKGKLRRARKGVYEPAKTTESALPYKAGGIVETETGTVTTP